MREIRIGHCLDVLREMDAASIQCVVTSPPYWGRRRYDGQQEVVWGGQPDCDHAWSSRRYYVEQSTSRRGCEAFSQPGPANVRRLKAARWREDATCVRCGAWRGAYGLEPTPELYVEHTVAILREIRRVLRPDGVLWLNLGDSYAGSGCTSSATPKGLKPKDLCLAPFRVALAVQADGWWLRSVVIWDKPNPKPEPVRDRPTEGHEYVLLLAKSGRYFYDADAVRERGPTRWSSDPTERNLRTVWEFSTDSYPGAHFAVFPPELPRRCILAGSPPKVCATCGAPWERQTRRDVDNAGYPNGPGGNYVGKGTPPGGQGRDETSTLGKVARYRVTTLGWQPTCQCHGEAETVNVECPECGGSATGADGDPCQACDGTGNHESRIWPADVLDQWPTRPAIVLDPFAGSGTTLMVAEELGRWWIGIDICDEYQAQIKQRTAQRSLAGALENAIH